MRILGTALLIAATSVLAGCYDAEALRKEHDEVHAAMGMEEVDLGAFRINLPHMLGDASDSIVDFHIFGHVTRRDRDEIRQALATRGPELRSRMLTSIRALSDVDFEEPKLQKLRAHIASVINGTLQDKDLVKRVGFYHFELTTL